MKKRFTVILLAAVMIVSVFAGCSPKEKKPETSAPGNAAEADGNADKELIVGTYEAVATLNFNNTAMSIDQVASYQVYDFLVSYNDDGKLEGSIAESWDISPDGKEYTFHIRKGVKFSDGSELKASDVKFSLDQTKASEFVNFALANMESCEVVDEYTVKLIMSAPDVTLLPFLTTVGVILSEQATTAAGDNYGKSPETTVGTGPYVLKEWSHGESLSFEANMDYFKGVPSIKKFKLKAITDVNAAMIALQTGEISIYQNDVPGIAYDTIANNDKLEMLEFPGARFYYVGMNCENGLFTDARLRKAVAYAVDREKALIAAFEGHGVVVDFPGIPDYAGYPDIDVWQGMDLEKARQLVKDAGMEGQTITLRTYSNSIYPKIATAVQDDLNQIGLKCEVELVEATTFNADVYASGNSSIFIAGIAGDILDMSSEANLLLLTKNIGAMNSPRYSNPTMDQLLESGQAENDNAKRLEIYKEAMTLLTEDAPLVPLFYPSGNRAYSKELVVVNKFAARKDHVYSFNWK